VGSDNQNCMFRQQLINWFPETREPIAISYIAAANSRHSENDNGVPSDFVRAREKIR
jgi:hypothetical protein